VRNSDCFCILISGVEKRMYRNANISVKGIGLQEFRSMCLKMKDAMQANEEIADMGGTQNIRTRVCTQVNMRSCLVKIVRTCMCGICLLLVGLGFADALFARLVCAV
jgi:hypothetical protein